MIERGETTNFLAMEQIDWTADRSRALIAAAHELKDPLTTLRFLLECVSTEYLQESNRQMYAKRAELLSRQMLRTIDGLLEGYTLQSSSQQLLVNCEPVNISAIAEQAAHELGPYADQYQQRIEVHKTQRQHIILANKNILNKILFQLMHTMMRANHKDSVVGLTFSQQKKEHTATIMVSGDQFLPGNSWRKESQHAMGATKRPLRHHPTSGLDLFVAQTLTEAMGGTMASAQKAGKQTYRVQFHSSRQLNLLELV